MKKRSVEDDLEMLRLAHSSRYHWGLVGTRWNRAIADWQVSRVYASLREPRLSLEFARSCLRSCERGRLSDIKHVAYEGLARAYAVADDYDSAKRYATKARQELDKLAVDKEDRKVYLVQISETEKLIRKR